MIAYNRKNTASHACPCCQVEPAHQNGKDNNLCWFCLLQNEWHTVTRRYDAQRVCPPGHYIVWDSRGTVSYRRRSTLNQKKQPYPKIDLDRATINEKLSHAVGNKLSAACDKWLRAIGKIEKAKGHEITAKPATETTRPQPVEPDRASFRCYEVRTNSEDEFVGVVTCDLCIADEVEIALRAWGYKVVRQ